MKNLKKPLFFLLLVFTLFVFCYFRLKPIYFQTFPYTFDQGRDFLKAQELIKEKNLTFIGAPTGIGGVFHGAWWYYYLAVPYLLFQGHPSGFPFFTFVTFLTATILFFVFLKRELNFVSSLFFLMLLAISPYLIQISFFVISSFPVVPLILFFLWAFYRFLKTKENRNLFFIFLSLGFILEAELPTGIFLVPSFLLTVLLTRNFKLFFWDKRRASLALIGFLIPVVPRILFEFKNNFMQTKAVLYFLANPRKDNFIAFQGGVFDQLYLFWQYDILVKLRLFWENYLSLFPDKTLAYVVLAIGLFGLFYRLKKTSPLLWRLTLFLLVLNVVFFLATLLYRSNFLWANYLEGFPLFYAFLLTIGVYNLSKRSERILRAIPYFLLAVLFVISANKLYREAGLSDKKISGIKAQVTAVEEIYKNAGKDDFCARIYTPPVIPYTYNYLFDYYSQKKGFKKPEYRFVKDQCSYIIEADAYAFRVENWRQENIPKKASLVDKKVINENVSVELWKLK
ncbi:hypothetical protein HYT33_00150 [Candidatus Roizmanbacteria bacterium]|nr:hypothetical protein [Candidatus Roizmanbacteria bacterium]